MHKISVEIQIYMNESYILVYLAEAPALHIPDVEICICVYDQDNIKTVKDMLVYVKSIQSTHRPFDGYMLPEHSLNSQIELEKPYYVKIIPCNQLLQAVYNDIMKCFHHTKPDPVFETSFAMIKYFCFIEPVKCPPIAQHSALFQELFRAFICRHYLYDQYELNDTNDANDTNDTNDMFSAFLRFYNQVVLYILHS